MSHLEAGTLAEGEAALAAMVDADAANDEARLGLGVIQFIQAIEHLSQGLYRYGLKSPESFMVPVLRLPVPENPNPQPITYEDFRRLLQDLRRGSRVRRRNARRRQVGRREAGA